MNKYDLKIIVIVIFIILIILSIYIYDALPNTRIDYDPERYVEKEIDKPINEAVIGRLYDEVASLTFKALGIYEEAVYLGSDETALKKGICLIEEESGWQYPENLEGRANISCHNYSFFKPLTKCKEGDYVGERFSLNVGENTYVYEVIKSSLVRYEDWEEKAYFGTPKGGVTICTCWPITKPGTKDSWVLNCKLVHME